MIEAWRAVRSSPRWTKAIDPLIFAGLFLGYLLALVATAESIGYARDEGFYFHAANTYGKWFELLLSDPGRAFSAGVVDRFWRENHEHPALMKSLFWLSQRTFGGRWFDDPGTALRFPAMLLSSLAVATTFAFGRRCIGRGAGVFAALSFGLMPAIFHNSHLACFDMPIAALWLFVVYAYQRCLETRGWGWALCTALLYGLALDTKHNSWLLPPAILAHAGLLASAQGLRRLRRGRSVGDDVSHRSIQALALGGAARAIVVTLLLAPLVFYALWPWIWRDTVPRLVQYVEFHRQHVYYNMEYLGRTYFEPPFPRSYAPLMTLATVPSIALVLALIGGATAARAAWRRVRAAAPDADPNADPDADPGADPPPSAYDGTLLWLLCIVASYFVWLLPDTPIFGGTKHWLSAYPFFALFAARGFAWLARALGTFGSAQGRPWLRAGAPYLLAFCTLVGPLAIAWHSVPWGLAAYMPIVGGAPGAATLGLNRSFWGYTTGSVTGFLNANVGRGERLFLHDTTLDSFRMLQRDGSLRRDIKPWGSVSGSSFALYHHEQHMARVEYMIWVDYGTTAPAHVATYDGVPVIWVYRRP